MSSVLPPAPRALSPARASGRIARPLAPRERELQMADSDRSPPPPPARAAGAAVGGEASASSSRACCDATAEPLLLHEGAAAPLAELADSAAGGRRLPGRAARRCRTRRGRGGAAPGSWLVPFRGHVVLASAGRRRKRRPTAPFRRHPARGATARRSSWASVRPRATGRPADLRAARRARRPSSRRTGPGRSPRPRRWPLRCSARREAASDPLTRSPGAARCLRCSSGRCGRVELERRPSRWCCVNPDDFVSVNDRFGREAGDRALREIADRLRSSCRGSDFLARYGSAIFACVLPDTPARGRARGGGADARRGWPRSRSSRAPCASPSARASPPATQGVEPPARTAPWTSSAARTRRSPAPSGPGAHDRAVGRTRRRTRRRAPSTG